MRGARRALTASTVVLAALLALAVPASPAAPSTAAQAVLDEINRVRAARGLDALQRDRRLTAAAQAHALDLLSRDAFEHGDVEARLRRFRARGPRFGENLAWGAGQLGTARALVAAWMRSRGHRTNLLRRGWRRVGIGVAVGTFSGHSGARVVAANFAGR